MKLVKFLFVVALLSLSAAAAQAGSITPGNDPKLTINKPGLAPGPFVHPNSVITFGDSVENPRTPLMINFNLVNNPGGEMFSFIGPNPIDSPPKNMYIEIFNIPANQQFSSIFTCNSNAFTSLGGGVCGGSGGVATSSTIEFSLFNGILKPGTMLDATLTPSGTPEPSSILLFLSLGPAIGFARKRWATKRA
jgi:hypothetical protein